MQPTRADVTQWLSLIAADTGTLNPVGLLHVHLSQNSVAPGLDVPLSAYNPECTFTGYNHIVAGAGAWTIYQDPATGLYYLQAQEPLGGWTWLCTGSTGLPQQIGAIYVTDPTDAVLIGADKVNPPVVLTASGQGFVWPEVAMQVNPTLFA